MRRDDIIGLDDAKQVLWNTFVERFKNPTLFQGYYSTLTTVSAVLFKYILALYVVVMGRFWVDPWN